MERIRKKKRVAQEPIFRIQTIFLKKIWGNSRNGEQLLISTQKISRQFHYDNSQ